MANTATWTVLPNGPNGSSGAKFSLFIALNLDSFVNWAEIIDEQVGQLRLSFADANGVSVGTTFNFTPSKALVNQALWRATFPDMALLANGGVGWEPVRRRAFKNYSARKVLSYPTQAIRQEIQTIYGFAGATRDDSEVPGGTCAGRPVVISGPEGFSPAYQFVPRPGSDTPVSTLSDLQNIARQLSQRLPGEANTGSAPGSVFDSNGTSFLTQFPAATNPFVHLYRFYRRDLNRETVLMAPLKAPPPSVPTISSDRVQNEDPDLHQVLASLGDHPALLRRFGLVLDAVITQQFLSTLPASAAMVRLEATGLPSGFTHERPYTRFTRTGGTFLPAPDPDPSVVSDIELGMLKLGSGDFDLQTFDPDNAGLKLITQSLAFLDQVSGSNDGSVGDAPARPFESDIGQELSNLRSAGLVVARNERADRVSTRFQRQNALNDQRTGDPSLPGVFLSSDDVLRGYRIDVLSQSDPHHPGWRSLCKRHGAYFLGDDRQRVPHSGEVHDEGYVKSTSAAATAVDPGQDLEHAYVHESAFEWSGWSLVVPPPGRLQVFDRTNGESVQDPNTQEPKTTIKVDPRFKVEPHSLPKLRFNETYALRARAVDLAGNSLPLETATTADSPLALTSVFKRYEPVPHPVLVLHRALVEGEALETIVIRSKSGRGHIPGNVFFSTNDRHVVPPAANLDIVIRHGRLDPFFDDPTRSFNIAAKVDGTLMDREVLDIRTGRRVPNNGVRILTGLSPNEMQGEFPPDRGVALQPGEYLVHTEERLPIPYLPDPLAEGITVADIDYLFGDPIVGKKELFFRGHWPEVEAPKLVVTATNAAQPSLDTQGGNLVIKLPPATILDLRYSSTMKLEELHKTAMWDLTMSTLFPDQFPDSLDEDHPTVNATNQGMNWMIQGRRTLKAVHAVERPLAPTTITSIAVGFNEPRQPETTFASLAVVANVHGHSTGRIDLVGTWTDPVDRLAEPAPSEEDNTGHVLATKIEYVETEIRLDDGVSEGFFPDRQPKHEFGDTKHRFVDYRFDATTRYREYFPASVTNVVENITFPGPPTQLNVPSSARPTAPEVLYVVPTFRWDDGDDDHGPGHDSGHHRGRRRHRRPHGDITSRRLGRGLRVYLSRPWYSSGIGERLGVVIPRDPAASDATETVTVNGVNEVRFSDPTRQFFSVWGADPIWDNLPPTSDPDGEQIDVIPSSPLTPADFVNAADTTTNPVSLLELLADDTKTEMEDAENFKKLVHVVAFDVEFNRDRKVWFADIEMADAPTNTPFVHLALVRYQKDSIANKFISGVVRAEFIQLMNDRVATLAVQRSTIQVSLSGVAAHNRFGDDSAPLQTPPATPPTPPPGFVFNQAAGAGRLVIAHVERRDEGASDLEWEREGAEVVLASFREEGATEDDFDVLWAGEVPRPRRSGRREHRLVLREIEVFYTDEDVAETLNVPVPTDRFVRGRVIYLDTIPLRNVEW